MKKLAYLAIVACLIPAQAFAWCGPIIMSGWYAMPAGPGAVVPLSQLNPYERWNSPGYALNGSFQNTVPAGTTVWITKMLFQTKGLPDWSGNWVNYGSPYRRNSYLVLGSLWTCSDASDGTCSFDPPLAVPAGYQFNMDGNAIINNARDSGGNNFIAMVLGFARDATCPWPQPVQGIPPGY